MLTAIVVLKLIVFIAGFALLGQGVLYVLAGAGRETNIFYRILRSITLPAAKLVRVITPRKWMPDSYVGVAAFFLMAGIYFALIIEQRAQCLSNLGHSACERLVSEYEQRCVGGDDEACGKLGRAMGVIRTPAAPGAKAVKP
jgi:hypothetical protein